MPDYKYKTSIVIGHRPDGRPIRKYIQDNSKMRFDAAFAASIFAMRCSTAWTARS